MMNLWRVTEGREGFGANPYSRYEVVGCLGGGSLG